MKVRLTITLAASTLLAGCASIMERTPGAPEWFDAKAKEIRGAGYPKLKDVPTVRPPVHDAKVTGERADTLRVELKEIEETIATDPISTPDEIRARAAQLRAKADETARPDPDGAANSASGSP